MLDIKTGVRLVKFSATWCAPCKVIANTIAKVAPEFQTVDFHNVDVDDYPNLAKDHKIKSVPTVIVFKDGEEVNRLEGNVRIDALRKALRDITSEQAA